jgi:hypothetical protein
LFYNCIPNHLLKSKAMRIFNVYIFLFFVATISSCAEEEPAKNLSTTDLYQIAEGYAVGSGLKLEIWTKEKFSVGPNDIVVLLYDSVTSRPCGEATVHVAPRMRMGSGLDHGAIVADPSRKTDALNRFEGKLFFPMPSSPHDSWEVGVRVHNQITDNEGHVSFPIEVSSSPKKGLRMVTVGEKTYCLAYQFEKDPAVGSNNLKWLLLGNDGLPAFSTVSNARVQVVPFMVGMNHGSPNNIDPVEKEHGCYEGVVNFTMTGEWELRTKVLTQGDASLTAEFRVVVK